MPPLKQAALQVMGRAIQQTECVLPGLKVPELVCLGFPPACATNRMPESFTTYTKVYGTSWQKVQANKLRHLESQCHYDLLETLL